MQIRHSVTKLRLPLFMAVLLACSSLGFSKAVTNETVLKLLNAEVGEALVMQVITSGETKFDTTPEAIAALKKAGATPAIITAVITGGQSAAQPAQPAEVKRATLAADAVLLRDGEAERVLTYTSAEMRVAARGMGFGGAAVYAVLTGSTSDQTVTPTPEFIVSVPSNAKPASFLQLASFAVRKNGNREVMVGGGVMSVSIGIHPDRVIAMDFVPLSDQSRAATGHTLYQAKPRTALAPGQFALVAKLSGPGTMGSAQISGQWYDFGVR
jgi:hypothetical protein